MEDKFFETVLDRFKFHAEPIQDHLRKLGWLHADYYKHLGPEFKDNLDKIGKLLEEMEEAVRALRLR